MILEWVCYSHAALSPVEELMWMGLKCRQDYVCDQLCLWLKLRHLTIPRDNFLSSAQQSKRWGKAFNVV